MYKSTVLTLVAIVLFIWIFAMAVVADDLEFRSATVNTKTNTITTINWKEEGNFQLDFWNGVDDLRFNGLQHSNYGDTSPVPEEYQEQVAQLERMDPGTYPLVFTESN